MPPRHRLTVLGTRRGPAPFQSAPLALPLPKHNWSYKSLWSATSLPQCHCYGTLCGSPCLLIPSWGCPLQISTWRTDHRQHILGLILWTSGKTATDIHPLCVLPAGLQGPMGQAAKTVGKLIFLCTVPSHLYTIFVEQTAVQTIRRKPHQDILSRGLFFVWFVVLLIK